MLEHHLRVLRGLGEMTCPGEMYVDFTHLTSRLGMSRSDVRRITRHLARKGLAEYERALVDEATGLFAGAGYCITPAGLEALAREDG